MTAPALVVQHDGSPALASVGRWEHTSLVLPPDLGYDEWAAIGQRLQAVVGRVQWWLGDWLNFGERQYGETYSQALSETPYAYQTLADAAWVTSRFDLSRRRESLSFSHHKEVAALSPAIADDWLDKAEAGHWSRRELREQLKVAKCHVSQNSGEQEWYTPAFIVEIAREVMGGIDCDPASSKPANALIKAARFYTAQDDGLVQATWGERCYLNPPYSQPLIGQFIDALADRLERRDVMQAVVLVNNATDTAWGQRLLSLASAVCFLRGRVRFLDRSASPSGAPLQGQMLVYVGPRVADFEQRCRDVGSVWRRHADEVRR